MYKVIKTEEEYDEALEKLDELMDIDPDPDSEKGLELELLSKLIGDYEEISYPMDLPDPVEAIKFCMEQQNLKQKDLVPYIGSKSKVSEVLSGKRGLSLNMIRKLSEALWIPAKILIAEVKTEDV